MSRSLLIALTTALASIGTATLVLQDDTSTEVQRALASRRPLVRDCPLPWCNHVPTVAELRAPGVGFALEMGYGTAVVRYHNGSYQNIVRIDGNDDYLTTLKRLAEEPKERMPYEYLPSMNQFTFVKAELSRWWNKKLGRPATETTAVLAKMVDSLRAATESVIGPVPAVAISSPDHIRLRHAELDDVTEYVGINNLMSWVDGPYALSAAFAGSGAGLCKEYIDVDACEKEEASFHFQNVLQLDLSERSFLGTINIMSKPIDGLARQTFIKPELGIDSSAGEEDAQYWSDISTSIRDLIKAWRSSRHITYLILSGSAASDAKFKSVVKDSLQDLVGSQHAVDTLQELDDKAFDDDDLVWLTARGAAEIAKRRQEGPVECMDHEEGKRRRREQRPDASGFELSEGKLVVQS